MAGVDNDVVYGTNVDFTGASPVTGQMTANGQLLIGSAAAPYIRAATLTSGDGSVTITNGAGTIDLAAAGGGGVDQSNIIYVGKHGNDGNDGKTEDKAKLTFGAAITAAAAIAPASVVCLDAGVYSEAITLQASVDIFAPEATLTGTIVLVDNSSVKFRTLNVATGTSGCGKSAGTGFAFADIDEVVCLGTGIAFASTAPTLHVRFKYISLVTGSALLESSGGSISAIGGDVIYSDAGYAIVVGTGSINAKVGRIECAGAGLSAGCLVQNTGYLNLTADRIYAPWYGIWGTNGVIDVYANYIEAAVGIRALTSLVVHANVNYINATTAVETANSTELYIHCPRMVGAENIGGSVYRKISAEDGCITPYVECEVASGDPYLLFNIGGTDEFVIGVDDDDSDKLKINQGGATPSAGTNTWTMTAAGERTMPLQPAFLAYMSASRTNVTGNNVLYTIAFDQEVYDQNSDFNTGTYTFTAPATGKYLFTVTVLIDELDATYTAGEMFLVTSNRTYSAWNTNWGAMRDNGNQCQLTHSVIADMDAADTCYVQIQVGPGGTAQTVDVIQNGATDPRTYFSGALIC